MLVLPSDMNRHEHLCIGHVARQFRSVVALSSAWMPDRRVMNRRTNYESLLS